MPGRLLRIPGSHRGRSPECRLVDLEHPCSKGPPNGVLGVRARLAAQRLEDVERVRDRADQFLQAQALPFHAARSGRAVIAGTTFSSDFPQIGGTSFGHAASNQSAFVAVLDATGSAFQWVTRLGGSGRGDGEDVAIAPSGSILVVGWTTSTDLPTAASALSRRLRGREDAFLTELSPAGQIL